MSKGLFERLQDEIIARDKQVDFGPIDVLALPKDLRTLIQFIMRRGEVSAVELVGELERTEKEIDTLLQSLVQKGFLVRIPDTDPPRYKAALGRRRTRQIPTGIWASLSDKLEEKE